MSASKQIDENKYSRQIGAYGAETMARLVQLRVLIVGAKGLGIETAKNLVLAGPAAVTLHDEGVATHADLGANFFLRPEHVGTRRAQAVINQLKALNDDVEIKTSREWLRGAAEAAVLEGSTSAQAALKELTDDGIAVELTEALVAAHDVIVFTTGTRDELLRWNNFCRSRSVVASVVKGEAELTPKPVKFIAAGTLGAAGYLFSDFGPAFKCHDENGEAPVVRHIRSITNAKEGVVTLLTEEEGGASHHGLPESIHDGYVTFSEVEGMYAKDEKTLAELGLNINVSGPWKVSHNTRTVMRKQRDGSMKAETVFDPYSFKIGDTSNLSPYCGRGFVTQFKKPSAVSARSLGATLQQPLSNGTDAFSFCAIDGNKFFRGLNLHFALQAVWEYEAMHGSLPRVGDAAAADAVVKIAEATNNAMKHLQKVCGGDVAASLEEIDSDAVRTYALYAGAEVQPIAAFFGGVTAQEVVKACAKFRPMDQWLHFDAFEILPETPYTGPVPEDSRYAHEISVFGPDFVSTLRKQKTFLVGCGALGCEFLKNFALMGLATAEGGLIHCTDNDRIEISNLNRQFLFRAHNVGQPKSLAASVAAKDMNPDLRVSAMEELVHEGSEHIFNDAFWMNLDFVTNALDNVKARKYVDGRCVLFEKALLESGTLGTKANVQVVLPHQTISYADGPEEVEQGIPMCTLRNFPSQIEHCIEWARVKFNDFFCEPFKQATKILKDAVEYSEAVKAKVAAQKKLGDKLSVLEKTLDELKEVRAVMEVAKSGLTFQTCVSLALRKFYSLFRDFIVSLTTVLPEDFKTSSGDPFWSGAKRFPKSFTYDPNDPYHVMFVTSMANVLAAAFGLVPAPENERNLLPATHEWRQPEYINAIVRSLPVPEYIPEKINMEGAGPEKDEESKEGGGEGRSLEADVAEAEAKLADQLAFVASVSASGATLTPADFEKDQDLNFHIDFITAASNLRAANYSIAQATRHTCKMIAGKIIPAIATTTASICGLVCLELYKLVQKKPMSAFRDCNVNLGVNTFQFFEPTPAKVIKGGFDEVMQCEMPPYKPEGFTKWDKFVVKEGDITLAELLNIMKTRYGLTVTFIESQKANLVPEELRSGKPVYGGFGNTKVKVTDVLLKNFPDLGIVTPQSTHTTLLISANNEAGDSVMVPHLIYYWA